MEEQKELTSITNETVPGQDVAAPPPSPMLDEAPQALVSVASHSSEVAPSKEKKKTVPGQDVAAPSPIPTLDEAAPQTIVPVTTNSSEETSLQQTTAVLK